MEINEMLDKLDEYQYQAAIHPLDDSAALVVAAAGSGKTSTMTARVKWCIDQGIPERMIGAVTFTNKAAGELRHRLGYGDDPDHGPRVSTIHSLSLGAIRKDPRGFGLSHRVTPLDKYDQKEFIERLLGLHSKDPKFKELKPWNVLEKFQYHRARGLGFFTDYTPDVHRKVLQVHSGLHALTPEELTIWEEYEKAKTCHPAGTKVLVVVEPAHQQNRIRGMIPARLEERPIESLKDGDSVVTWRRKDGRVLYCGRPIRVAHRNYRGDMLALGVSDGNTVKVTPDHYMWVRFNENIRGKFFVYLMFKAGLGFRVGVSTFKRGAGSGISMRLYAEGGDCLWVLKVCDSKFEATTWEQVISFKYGIPQTLWAPREERHQELIRLVFTEADPEGGRRCLAAHHLLEEEPLIRRGVGRCTSACMRFFKTAAANVLPGLMNVPAVTRPTWDGGRQQRWRIPTGVPVIHVARERFEGQVFSLDVDSEHTYVADGVIVANCASVVDFDDMLHLVVRRGRQDDAWRAKVQRQFYTVLVDESQDTNCVQWEFIEMLLPQENRNLYAVGDLSQSIYSFSGAAPEILAGMVQTWRDGTPSLYKLKNNYRSVQSVVNLANRIQMTMTGTVPLTMYAARKIPEGQFTGKVTRIEGQTPRDVAQEIALAIMTDNRKKTGLFKFRDNAILVRSSSQIPDIEAALVSYRIPYIVRDGVSLMQTEEAKDLFSYLKLLVNPQDISAFSRAITIPKRGVGPAAIEKVRKIAEERFGGNIIEACCSYEHMTLRPWGQALKEMEAIQDPADLLLKVIRFTNYKDIIADRYRKDHDRMETKLGNLERLKDAIGGLVADSPTSTAADIIFKITMDGKAEADTEDGAVIVSTIHSAKGLEWPRVYVAGMIEGSIPIRYARTPAEIEEERRLFYVAVTRARDYLALCVPRVIMRGPNSSPAIPSRFLVELGIAPTSPL